MADQEPNLPEGVEDVDMGETAEGLDTAVGDDGEGDDNEISAVEPEVPVRVTFLE